jgi:hypothetical protein
MEGDARDITRMAIEGENGVRIRRLYVVELDSVVPGGSEVTFVWRDAETVHLRVWVGDRSRANSGESFPKAMVSLLVDIEASQGLIQNHVPYRMVVPSCRH